MFQYIADICTYNLFRLESGTALASSVNFFIYDVLKIAFSILLVITLISFLRTYISPKKIKRLLSRQRFGIGYLIAAIFGAISPFCSCSSIPFFIGFLEAGVPMGVAFAFLITSPLVNEIIFVLMLGTFGPKVAFTYAGFGILLGVTCGMILQQTNLKHDIIKLDKPESLAEMPQDLQGKLKFAYAETAWIFKKVFPFILIGVGIGAIIHGYVPTQLITQYIKSESIFAVPLAVIIGVPLYAGCSTLVPVVFAFTQKGIAIGTALAFMMAIAGLSFPEAIILKSVMRLRLLLVFFGIVALGIMAVGYLFNFLF
ncbi:MAG: permease [Candidatus Margulisbacteria bacterium]|nr:permease [Candidatus Margulisiibacteriota bacterium]